MIARPQARSVASSVVGARTHIARMMIRNSVARRAPEAACNTPRRRTGAGCSPGGTHRGVPVGEKNVGADLSIAARIRISTGRSDSRAPSLAPHMFARVRFFAGLVLCGSGSSRVSSIRVRFNPGQVQSGPVRSIPAIGRRSPGQPVRPDRITTTATPPAPTGVGPSRLPPFLPRRNPAEPVSCQVGMAGLGPVWA